MINGVSLAKNTAPAELNGHSSSSVVRKMSDIQDRRKDFKGLCNIPAQNLSFGSYKAKIISEVIKDAASQNSTFEKLIKRVFAGNKIANRIKDPRSLGCKLDRKGGDVRTVSDVHAMVKDVLGATGITDGSQKRTNDIVKNLINEIKEGRLIITGVKNNGSFPYLNNSNIQSLQRENLKKWGNSFEIKKPVAWGYPAAKIECKPGKVTGLPKGRETTYELQIIGNKCYEENDPTHLILELREKRFMTGKSPDRKATLGMYNKFNDSQKQLADNWVNEEFLYRRGKELKMKMPPPRIAYEIYDFIKSIIKLQPLKQAAK